LVENLQFHVMTDDNEAKSSSQKIEQDCIGVKEALYFLQPSELPHLELEFENYKILHPLSNTASGVH